MPRITQKGQVTIPLEIRNKFALLPGSDVEFIIRNNEVTIMKSRKENKFLKWLGSGGKRSQKDIEIMIGRLRGRTDE